MDIDWSAVGVAAACLLIPIIGVAWVVARARKPSTQAATFIDAGPTKIDLQPWSETRGHYFFAVAELPDAYGVIEGGNLAQAFGEDEADARLKMREALALKAGLSPRLSPAITGAVVRFRPLVRRKGQ